MERNDAVILLVSTGGTENPANAFLIAVIPEATDTDNEPIFCKDTLNKASCVDADVIETIITSTPAAASFSAFPFDEISPKPIATAPRDFAISIMDSSEMI